MKERPRLRPRWQLATEMLDNATGPGRTAAAPGQWGGREESRMLLHEEDARRGAAVHLTGFAFLTTLCTAGTIALLWVSPLFSLFAALVAGLLGISLVQTVRERGALMLGELEVEPWPLIVGTEGRFVYRRRRLRPLPIRQIHAFLWCVQREAPGEETWERTRWRSELPAHPPPAADAPLLEAAWTVQIPGEVPSSTPLPPAPISWRLLVILRTGRTGFTSEFFLIVAADAAEAALISG